MGRINTNITTQDRIEATKYMLEFTEDKVPVIAGICEANQLTPDFVREFYPLLTKPMFTLSYRLSTSLIDMFPELFDEIMFKEVYGHSEEEVNNFIMSKQSNGSGGQSSLSNLLTQLMGMPAGIINFQAGQIQPQNQPTPQNTQPAQASDEEEGEKKEEIMLSKKRLTMSTLERYFNIEEIETDILLNTIRMATPEEINDSELVMAFIGFDNSIDDILLMRITDNDTKNSIIMKKYIEEGQITPSGFKYIDSETRELIIGTDNVNIETYLKALSLSDDLGWQIKMVKKIESEDMSFQTFRGTLDEEMLLLVANLPEDLVVKLTALSNYASNIFSYKVLHWALLKKEFSEEHLIKMKDLFIKAGMKFELRNFAKQHEYEELLKVV